MHAEKQRPQQRGRFHESQRKWLGIIGVSVVGLRVVGVVLARHWPFSRQRVIADLQDDLHGTVTFGRFRITVFPHPGCVAEGAKLVRTYSHPEPGLEITGGNKGDKGDK